VRNVSCCYAENERHKSIEIKSVLKVLIKSISIPKSINLWPEISEESTDNEEEIDQILHIITCYVKFVTW